MEYPKETWTKKELKRIAGDITEFLGGEICNLREWGSYCDDCPFWGVCQELYEVGEEKKTNKLYLIEDI